jgi:hypothetical protein
MPATLKRISVQSGAEVVFKSNCFEVYGLADEVRAVIQLISELDIVKVSEAEGRSGESADPLGHQGFLHEIRFQIELAADQREFISGKKNGKINKIMQAANVKIKFETFNDYNFLIDLSGSDMSVLQGLAMLHDELPAEISFHVPELYHKRIIGVGGKSIQRIMKKYAVYVKFSNAEELAALGGYMDVEDNVVARTPAKNAMNLESLKQAILELVGPKVQRFLLDRPELICDDKDKDFVLEALSVPRRYHRNLLGEKSIFIHDIENKTNSHILFPFKETGSEIITIFGPETQVQIATAMLLDHIPFEAEMPVPYSSDLTRLCASAEFSAFAEQIKREFQVTISSSIKKAVPPPSPSPGSAKRLSLHECSFKFACQRSSRDSLGNIREALEQFLVEHNVHVYPTSNVHKRADSFADAFPHFNSKLLSSAATTGRFAKILLNYVSNSPSDTPLLAPTDRKVRLAASSPNVKALFNNSAPYRYQQPDTDTDTAEDSPSTAFSPTLLDDYWTPLPSIVSRISER